MNFIKKMAAALSDEWWPVIFRAARNLLIKILSIVSIPIVLIARLLRPFVLIRFGRLIVVRIGHMGWNTEFYVCERELSSTRRRTIDLFWCSTRPANKQLLKMWHRILNVSGLVRPLWDCNRFIPGGEEHEISDTFSSSYEYARNLLTQTRVHLRFTPGEEETGAKNLRDMGIPDDKAFICFHARDNAFLDKEQPGRDWSYHDFRDAKIENFLLAADEMTRRGYFAIRLGAIVKGPLLTNNPMIFDYSTKFRSDFLDVFLLARCRFLIGTNCGVTDLADILRKPVVKTNAIQFGAEIPLCGSKDLFIPKKFWLRDEKRLITFRELIDKGLRMAMHTVDFEQCGVEVIENSAEEIFDASVEMDERLKGTWQTTGEDEELQGRFWKIVADVGLLAGPPVSRIGSRFLRQNRNLLE